MDFRRSRVRGAEIAAAAAAVLLLADMFALPWYGYKAQVAPFAARLGVSISRDGWTALSSTRWLLLVTIAAALALLHLQGTRPAPALPSTFSLLVTLLGALSTLALIYRVLINVPGPNDVVSRDAGGFVGLACALAIACSGYRSLHQEGIAREDEPVDIPTVPLHGSGVSAPSQPPVPG